VTVNPPNPGNWFNDISNAFVAIRDDYEDIMNLNDGLVQMAGEAGVTPSAFLQAPPYNLSAPDANALVASLGNYVALSVGFNGGAAPPVLNYRLNAAPFWNGK
jgi:hypothetical protein